MPETFITSFPAFINQTPSEEYIQAVTSAQLRVISRTHLEKLTQRVPKMETIRRIITEQQYLAAEQRIAMLQSQTGEQRYHLMMQQNPEVILHFPLQHIASYLGISPQHLSRLRKNTSRFS
ncbi:MAG: hypothetical protein R6U85_06850 [Salinivirgaceae bacterium]